jgi:aminoglycoside phosphotransferase (APT) family kinase protein
VDSHARLRLVAGAAGLTLAEPPVPLPSDSNDAWKIDELVLRICWRGDRTRLRREALILEHLPDEVPHVRLVAAGVNDDLTWTLTHWVPGTMLSHGWPDLDRTQQRTAAEQLGHALRALHAWEPSPEVRAALAARPAQPDTSDVIGADLNPLPVDRALRLVEPATHLENVDQQLVVQLGEEIKRLRPIDPLRNPSDGVVVHGDAHLNNVIWDGVRLVALLDYEWVRLGPPDLELQPLLVSDDANALIRSVVDAYPGTAAHPRFVERLWLYDLSATLRDLLVKAPLPATADLPPWHPKRRLPMVLAGPGYIEALLSHP